MSKMHDIDLRIYGSVPDRYTVDISNGIPANLEINLKGDPSHIALAIALAIGKHIQFRDIITEAIFMNQALFHIRTEGDSNVE